MRNQPTVRKFPCSHCSAPAGTGHKSARCPFRGYRKAVARFMCLRAHELTLAHEEFAAEMAEMWAEGIAAAKAEIARLEDPRFRREALAAGPDFDLMLGLRRLRADADAGKFDDIQDPPSQGAIVAVAF